MAKGTKPQGVQRRAQKGSRNISKKDWDKVRRQKRALRLEKIKVTKARKEKEEKVKKLLKRKEKGLKEEEEKEEEWEDVDEHEKDVFDRDGFYDVPGGDEEDFKFSGDLISAKDEQLLRMIQKQPQKKPKKQEEDKEEEEEGASTLADLIMQKLEAGDYQVAGKKELNKAKMVADKDYDELEEGLAKTMDPKVVAAFRSIGQFLRTYKSGKMPKAFSLVPRLANWEDVLFMTRPEKWSVQATYQATKMFSSNMNEKMIQRFYSLVLLPAVRENIQTYKKLNYHLYMALKKALYKPAAFFKGLLLPLAEDASSREAVILGSILAKMSIPILHASATLIKLSELPYGLGSGFFIKILLSKNYHFPTKVLDVMVEFFVGFGEEMEEQEMPVIWHQSLLSFVANYKHYFTSEHREMIRELLKVRSHYLITSEIRKELFGGHQEVEMEVE